MYDGANRPRRGQTPVAQKVPRGDHDSGGVAPYNDYYDRRETENGRQCTGNIVYRNPSIVHRFYPSCRANTLRSSSVVRSRGFSRMEASFFSTSANSPVRACWVT